VSFSVRNAGSGPALLDGKRLRCESRGFADAITHDLGIAHDHSSTAVRSCHGPGKTAIAAMTALWFFASFRACPSSRTASNHSLRRTFASLLYEAGASPVFVMNQMGHTSSSMALEGYARKMDRERDTGAKMDALIRPADWATTGKNSADPMPTMPAESTLHAD
jgi:integrase